MKLIHIVQEIEPMALPRLRIKAEDMTFSYESEEFARHADREYEEWEIVEDYANRNLLLYVFKEKRGEPKIREKPYAPDEPLYPGIGV